MNNRHTKVADNDTASIDIKGFVVTNEYKVLCKKLFDKEITMAEYIGHNNFAFYICNPPFAILI